VFPTACKKDHQADSQQNFRTHYHGLQIYIKDNYCSRNLVHIQLSLSSVEYMDE
jgi:hypothetical protein